MFVLRGKLRPFDYAAIVYIITLCSLIITFGGLSGKYGLNVLALILYLALLLFIVGLWGNRSSGWRAFIRRSYPLFSFTFLYEQTGQFIHLIFPGFFDAHIIHLEDLVFGRNPTLLLQSISYPIINEIFHFGYFMYYFLILVLALYLYFKRLYSPFEKLVTATSLAFYISYLFFILYPVEGPRLALASEYTVTIKGYIFVPLARFVINNAGLRGGCMPSSHVAIGAVTTLLCWKYAKKLFPYFLTISILLAVGTFWGRFHYLADALAGIVVGLFAFWLTEKLTGHESDIRAEKPN